MKGAIGSRYRRPDQSPSIFDAGSVVNAFPLIVDDLENVVSSIDMLLKVCDGNGSSRPRLPQGCLTMAFSRRVVG